MKTTSMRLTKLELPAALMLSGPAGADARDLRVMTFNVRYPNPDDAANVWANRWHLFVRIIRAADPDVIGTLQLFLLQGDDVVRALPQAVLRWPERTRGR